MLMPTTLIMPEKQFYDAAAVYDASKNGIAPMNPDTGTPPLDTVHLLEDYAAPLSWEAIKDKVGEMINSASPKVNDILTQVNSALNSFTSGLTSSADAANRVAQQNNASAQNFAREQMQFSSYLTRELRRTAYQDTVHSLREAGLNPMLAYMNGAVSASAPTSSVSAAQTFQEHQNLADNIISVIKLISDVFGSVTSAVKGMTK